MDIKKIIALLLLLAVTAFAHGEEEKHEEEHASIWEKLKLIDPIEVVYTAGTFSGLIIIIALMAAQGLGDEAKKILFILIAAPIGFATLYLAATTVYLNLASESQGPVHWHADYEIWACGKQYELVNPTGIENRVGSAVFHEHNDNRMHVEGVLVEKSEAKLKRFFAEVGGSMTKDEIILPTNEGLKEWSNGERCNGEETKLQVFVYRIINANQAQKTGFVYKQEKIGDYEEYVLSPYSNVPPGDCIIIEFDKEKNSTDKICDTYEIAMEKGDMKAGGYGS